MKVLFFEPYTRYINHLGASLELIEKHISQQDEILVLNCNGSIVTCDVNVSHSKVICSLCKLRGTRGFELLKAPVQRSHFSKVDQDQKAIIAKLSESNFLSQKELETLSYKNFDLGSAIISTIVSDDRNPIINMDQSQSKINKLISTAMEVYFSLQNHIKEYKPAIVYIFNGRLALLRAAMRACESTQTNFIIHERGSSNDRYGLFKNHLPHSIPHIQKLIEQSWSNATDSERAKISATFYKNRMAGIIENWRSFTDQQNKEQLPPNWDPTKKNIAIFNSSEDEFVSIGKEWKMTLFDSQNQAMEIIFERLSADPEIQFYVRVHPNLAEGDSSIIDQINNLSKFHNVNIIPPLSKVSSYKLMHESWKVITFGSTMGVEAAYAGKVSICLGKSYYQNLGSVYVPKTQSEAIEMIQDQSLTPLPKTGAMKYGHYMSSFGEKYVNYIPGKDQHLFTGSFKGKNLDALNIGKHWLNFKDFKRRWTNL